MKINGNVEVADETIADFCRKWKITKLEAFGSALRDDFGPESDVDLLVTFEEGAGTSLFDLVEMEGELAGLLGRPVDLVDRRGIEGSENYIRRKAILGSAQPVFRRA